MSLLPMGNNDTTGGLLGGGASRGGLLGGLLPNDPRQQAWNQAAFALLATPGNIAQKIGGAGLAGLSGYQSAQQNQLLQKYREMQMQQMQSQMEEQRKAQEQKAKIDEIARQSYGAIPIQPTDGDYQNSFDTGGAAPPTRGFGMDQEQFLDRLSREVSPLVAQQYMPKTDYKVVGNNLVGIGPGGVKPVYEAPTKEATPTNIREYEYAVRQGYQGSFDQWSKDQKRAGASNTSVSYGAPVAAVDPFGNPVFFQPDKGGGAPAIVPGVAPPKNEKPMTEAQAKAATFKSQMEAAEKELQSVPINPSSITSQLDVMLAGGVTNPFASPNAQRARQAQEQWSESFLRFKTGAAATKDEVLLNVRTFFPQPGDSKAVVEQKARMRKQAMKDIEFAASGKAPGQPAADGWSITPVGQ